MSVSLPAKCGTLYLGAVFLLLVAAGYFSCNAITGNRGLLTLISLREEIKHYGVQLEKAVSTKYLLENKIRRLQENDLDLDLLDEQVRLILGYAEKGEIVFFRHSEAKN